MSLPLLWFDLDLEAHTLKHTTLSLYYDNDYDLVVDHFHNWRWELCLIWTQIVKGAVVALSRQNSSVRSTFETSSK